jgi:hypothetical protein
MQIHHHSDAHVTALNLAETVVVQRLIRTPGNPRAKLQMLIERLEPWAEAGDDLYDLDLARSALADLSTAGRE